MKFKRQSQNYISINLVIKGGLRMFVNVRENNITNFKVHYVGNYKSK